MKTNHFRDFFHKAIAHPNQPQMIYIYPWEMGLVDSDLTPERLDAWLKSTTVVILPIKLDGSEDDGGIMDSVETWQKTKMNYLSKP